MNRLLPFHRVAFSVLVGGLLLWQSLSAQTPQTVTIFHFNDTHSYLFPWGEKVNDVPQNGAASRFVKRLNDLRQSAVNPLLLHGGDSFTGGMAFNRFLGRAEFALFDTIGVDALVLGNHDFDIRPFRLKNAILQSRARFPFLSANIEYNADTSGLAALIKPYVIKTIGSATVGIFGLTTRSTVSYGESAPITFSSTVSTARRMVDSLKANNADLIVALTHLGVSEDRQIANQVDGIDVIVGGHSHTALTSPVLEPTPSGDTTLIIQAGSKWEYLGVLELTVGGGTKSWTYTLEQIGAPLPDDPIIGPYIEELRDSIVAEYGPVFSDTVAVLSEDLPRFDPLSGDIESALLNLIVDAYRSATGADVALETGALLRQNLHAGRITTSDVRNILSWSYDPVQGLGKRLSMVEVTGSMLKFILNTTLSFTFSGFGGGAPTVLPFQASGMQLTIDGWGTSPFVRDLWVGGVPVVDEAVYSVVLNEFVADFARQVPFVSFLSRNDTTFGPAEALSQHLASLSPLGPGSIPMGRAWNTQTAPGLTFQTTDVGILVQWTSSAPGFNIYRRSTGSNLPPLRLNSVPLVQTSYLDGGVQRGDRVEYQLEELRSNGTRVFWPQQGVQAGPLPSTAYLYQNYPNPFNASTRIVYGVPRDSRVSLRVYNVLGEVVQTLVDGEKYRGEFEAVWDGTTLAGTAAASGVYFVVFSAETFQTTGKVLLLR